MAVLRAINLPDIGGDTIWVDAILGLTADWIVRLIEGRVLVWRPTILGSA